MTKYILEASKGGLLTPDDPSLSSKDWWACGCGCFHVYVNQLSTEALALLTNERIIDSIRRNPGSSFILDIDNMTICEWVKPEPAPKKYNNGKKAKLSYDSIPNYGIF